IGQQPLDVGLGDRDDGADQHGEDRHHPHGGPPVPRQLAERDIEDAQQRAERGDDGAGGHQRGHRGGRALVDVRLPARERDRADLERRPDASRAIPAYSSVEPPTFDPAAAAIAASLTEPEYPYSMATPNRKNADENAPSRKYLTAASCESRRRRRASPHSRYSGRDRTSSATNMVSRSLEAGNSSIPPTANRVSGETPVS